MKITKNVGSAIAVFPADGFDAEVEIVNQRGNGKFQTLVEIQQGKSSVALSVETIALILRWAQGDESYAERSDAMVLKQSEAA
jgi:hypothetical protein